MGSSKGLGRMTFAATYQMISWSKDACDDQRKGYCRNQDKKWDPGWQIYLCEWENPTVSVRDVLQKVCKNWPCLGGEGTEMTKIKMIHIMDKNEGCVDYVILGIQQRRSRETWKENWRGVPLAMLVSQGEESLSHSWSREQGWKVRSRKMPAVFLWSGTTNWKRRRSHVKFGVGQAD